MSRQRTLSKTRPAAAAPAPANPVAPSRAAGIALLLAAFCFLVYLTNMRSMASWAWDSIPARLLPVSILREGDLDLDEFHWLFQLEPKPYFLRRARGGHFFSSYPIGAPLLATPLYVPAVWWLQHRGIPDDDVRFRLATVVMERVSAAAIAAASVAVLFIALLYLTSTGMAAGMALAYGLSTGIWSVGSQSLLQHGSAALALAGMSVFFLSADTRLRAVAAGGFAALGVLVRPTMVVFALVALVFMWRERRRNLLPFLALPLAGMACLASYNMRLPSLLRGGYRGLHFAPPRLWRLAGLLFSPNRGLFVYTPAAALAVAALAQRGARRPRWVTYLAAGVAGYLLLYSSWQGWWGGNCYGPRFLTDVLPAITLCTAPAVEKLWRGGTGRFLLLLLVAWGVAVQAIGVYWDDNSWNTALTRRLHLGKRAWDWSDLQIVRAARAGWHGTELAPLLWQAVSDARPAILRPLDPGDLAGEITAEDSLPLRRTRGGVTTVHVRVTNRGSATWPVFSDYGYLQCKLGYRWWSNGKMLPQSGAVALPKNLAAGESIPVSARIYMPRLPGEYELELVVVQVLGTNKGLSGAAALRLPVHVE